MSHLLEKMLQTTNPIISAFIGMLLVLFVFWILTYVDKYLRVKIFLLMAPWQRVDNFSPGHMYSYHGVYIWQKRGWIFWHTVYVGQSVNVRRRYNQHITGKGSPDIYQDYKKAPEKLRWKAIDAKRVHYKSLDALEKRLIDSYGTYKRGYNKTAGNGHRHY